MPPDSIEQVRNLVLIGHRGCGKTSLGEAMLFDTGMIKRLGTVEGGTTTSDVDPEETERGISIATSLAYVDHRDHKINLIDTPGYAEFVAETTYGIWAADIGAVCVDAAAGVEVHTRKVWAMARERGLALMGIVCKMDKERADYAACVANMKEVLPGCHPVAVQLPIGSESKFSGVIDLLKMKAFTGKGVEGDLPADMADEAAAARTELVEAVVETHDDLMEKYLADEAISPEELVGALREAVAKGDLVPIVATAGTSEIGTLPVLDLVVDLFPSPTERPAWVGEDPSGAAVEHKADPSAPFSAIIFKTLSDPYVGRISLLRVVSGMARADAPVVVGDSGDREKMSGLGLVMGRTTSQTGELWPGDLGCVTRLEHGKTGDTLCDNKSRVVYAKPHLPTPMHSLALRGETRQDEDKMAPSLERAADEDAGFRYERSPDTNELVVSGMGSLHLETVIARLQRQFGLKVQLSEPKIPYRETVTRKVRVHGRHKKQTGGRGQFGDVWVQLEPVDRGSGFEFVDAVVGGSVPNSFIPSVEKGCRAALAKGPLAGFPVVDVRATLDDGQTHPVDSSDMAFQLAGQIAMREALQEAGPILLEPIMNVEITAPEDLVGDLVSDLNSRRARILGMEPVGGGMTILRASVPLVEMARYSADLRSMSQGRASYIMEYDRYDPVPQQLTEQIVAKHKAAEAEEA